MRIVKRELGNEGEERGIWRNRGVKRSEGGLMMIGRVGREGREKREG